ncbi:MAG: hypothetical protein JST25_04075 [Actinobacteria bacterium]|nr:hypothetical protein [Actinomycetota bacterium]
MDPITDPDNLQQNLGYAYSGNNPITFSDPTGLIIDEGCGGWHVVCGAHASTPGFPIQTGGNTPPSEKGTGAGKEIQIAKPTGKLRWARRRKHFR